MTSAPTFQIRRLPSDQDASGRTLGEEEIAAVTAAIRTGTLTSTETAVDDGEVVSHDPT